MRHLEDREQIALITWVRLMESKHPELSTIYHCPNGGHRDIRTAAKFKAMGVKAGVWDIFLPAPVPGLYIEMKAGKGSLSIFFRIGEYCSTLENFCNCAKSLSEERIITFMHVT